MTTDPSHSTSLLWFPASSSALSAAELGGKGSNLARLVSAGSRVPDFFMLPVEAFASVLGTVALPADGAGVEERRNQVLGAELPQALRTALQRAVADLGAGDGLLAVRSSAVGEDGGTASFAGQFETVLGVPPREDAVWDAVRHVWASSFSPHALAYLREQGEKSVRMAVVVQRLVQPEVSGVVFTLDPVSGDRDTAVVSAVYGLGEGLVSGALDADTFRVRFAGDGRRQVEAALARKEEAVRPTPDGGTATEAVDAAMRDAPSLTDAEAVRIAEAARELAARLGGPQDVEWALAPGAEGPRTLWILQARPVTAAAAPTRALPGERRTWDNQNIVEPYPGITLPLSYSIAQVAMGQVFVAYARTFGAPADLVEANRAAFDGILALIRGRVYYNLRNYLRSISLVPGISVQGDEMMRVPLPPDPPGTPAPAAGALPGALLLAARVLPISARLLRETARLEGELGEFSRHAAYVLDPLARADLGTMTVDELRGVYTQIDRELLRRWHAPMLNDGLLDLWMMVMGQTLAAWLPGSPPTLMNDLVSGDGGMVSTEPVRRLGELAAQARADEAARALLEGDADAAEAWRQLTTRPEHASLAAALHDYAERYGDRCADEMKVEARTFADDPAFLVETLQAQVRAPAEAATGARGAELRAAAEAHVRERLPGGRQVPFFAVLEQVRRQMRARENTRFERTRAMGMLRRAFLALGSRLADAGVLESGRDVVYLTKEELFAFLDGSSPGGLRALATARCAEFDAYSRMPELPERFTTTGPPALSPIEPYRGSIVSFAPPPPSGDGLRGMGCCAGIVRAPVRIVHDPRNAGELAGHILVARQTDPGWTLLFTRAAGVLVQRGSLLSHAAIVAREMGIPCIVAIPDLLARLEDGEVVEMDGAAGTVRKLQGLSPAP
jgi:phosphohistidine swiveling domain-containing protein